MQKKLQQNFLDRKPPLRKFSENSSILVRTGFPKTDVAPWDGMDGSPGRVRYRAPYGHIIWFLEPFFYGRNEIGEAEQRVVLTSLLDIVTWTRITHQLLRCLIFVLVERQIQSAGKNMRTPRTSHCLRWVLCTMSTLFEAGKDISHW